VHAPVTTRSNGKRVVLPRAIRAPRRSWWAPYVCVAGVFWLMLWAGINTGPWVFYRSPVGLKGWLHFARTAFPLVVFVAAPLIAARTRGRVGLPGPLKLWVFYGIVGLGASALLSPRPLDAMYWGVCYLAAFAALAAYLRGGRALERSIELNYLTWLVTTGILALLCIFARHVLADAVENDMSAYGVRAQVGSVGGVGIPLASGFARFAAVPAVVAYVMLWRDRLGWRRAFWAALFAGACLLIYMLQSRGATFSLAFALVVATYVLGGRTRMVGLAAVLLGAAAVALEFVPHESADHVYLHLTRGERASQIADMTGRTWYWAQGWKHIVESPVFGYGFQSDRFLRVGHIHDTYLYALLTAGFVGLVPFVAGLAWAWLAALRAYQRRLPARLGQQAVFAQAVGILAFFTARSIPEVCGALFMVDLMVMLPAIAYLAILHNHSESPRRIACSARGNVQSYPSRQQQVPCRV